jgi:hypothetical protein
MRFSTENEALDYIIGKPMKDAANPTAIHISKNREESRDRYSKWI